MPLIIDATELKESIRKYITEFLTNKVPITYSVSNDTLKELNWLNKTIMNEFKMIVLEKYTKQKITPISGTPLPEHIAKCINPLVLGNKLVNIKNSEFGSDLDGLYSINSDSSKCILVNTLYLYEENKDNLLAIVEKCMIGIKTLNDLNLLPKLQNIYICSTSDGQHLFLISILDNPSSKGTLIGFKDWLQTNPTQSQKNKVKNFINTQLSKFTQKTGINFFSISSLQISLYLIIDNRKQIKSVYFSEIKFSSESLDLSKKARKIPYIQSDWDEKIDDIFALNYQEKTTDDNDKITPYVIKRLLQNGDLVYKI